MYIYVVGYRYLVVYREADRYVVECRDGIPEVPDSIPGRARYFFTISYNCVLSIIFMIQRNNRMAAQKNSSPLTCYLIFQVNVVFTQYGRAVHASEKIEPGENCFRDKPVVLAQTLDTMQVQACSHCAKNLMRAEEYFGKELLSKNNELRKLTSRFWPVRPKVGCKKCGDKTIYCSTECRDESWSQYHEVLCVSVNPVVKKLHDLCHKYKDLSTDSRCWKGYWNASFSPFVLAKVWASVISLANTLASQNGRDKPSNEDWTMAKSPFRK